MVMLCAYGWHDMMRSHARTYIDASWRVSTRLRLRVFSTQLQGWQDCQHQWSVCICEFTIAIQDQQNVPVNQMCLIFEVIYLQKLKIQMRRQSFWVMRHISLFSGIASQYFGYSLFSFSPFCIIYYYCSSTRKLRLFIGFIPTNE